MEKVDNKKEQSVLRLLWKMMMYKPGLYAWNCFLWVLIHVEPLILGIIIKEFFDILVGNETWGLNIWSIVAITLAYAVGRIVNIYFGAKVDTFHRFTMSALLRNNIFESILKKPGACAINCSSGEALNCFRDDAQMIEDVISWTLDIIGCTVFAIIAVVILLKINVEITVFVFAPLVIVVGIVQALGDKLHKYRKAAREATGVVTGAMGEIFSSVQAVKVAGAEAEVLDYLGQLNKKRHKLMLKDTLLMQLLDSIFLNSVSLGTGFILLLSASLMKASFL